MGMLIKGMLALVWLVLIPAAAGVPFAGKKNPKNAGETFLIGYLVLFTVMEVLTLPMTFLRLPLHMLTVAYGTVAAALAVWGIFCLKKRKFPAGNRGERLSVYFWVAILVILFQVAMYVFLAEMDADDCFYVAAATTDVHTDTIFEVNPYTGRLYKAFPERYVLSPFPVFLAVVSQLSAGLHPAIMAHTIFPVVLLPMAYVVQACLAKKWFAADKKAQGIYLLLITVACSFSAYSTRNAGSFQMIRIWQGKAVLAAVLLPLLLYLCITILLERREGYPWYYLLLANTACCLVSSMGIMLSPLMIGGFCVVSLIWKREWKIAAAGLCCCLPSVFLGVIHIFLA